MIYQHVSAFRSTHAYNLSIAFELKSHNALLQWLRTCVCRSSFCFLDLVPRATEELDRLLILILSFTPVFCPLPSSPPLSPSTPHVPSQKILSLPFLMWRFIPFSDFYPLCDLLSLFDNLSSSGFPSSCAFVFLLSVLWFYVFFRLRFSVHLLSSYNSTSFLLFALSSCRGFL